VFVDGQLMVEARWPNMPLNRFWDRGRWARAGQGSRCGRMVDPALTKTDIDWTDAIANNVARTICGDNRGSPFRFPESMSNNFTGDQPLLANVKAMEFWPAEGSPLIDAGKLIAGFSEPSPEIRKQAGSQ
jgi:hypothetical protein